MDLKIELLSAIDTVTTLEKQKIVDFLYNHLDEYGDNKPDIMRALEYALSDRPGQGGLVLVGKDDDKIVTCVVINKTGMSGYIPENILVYIATHEDYRGKGLGKKIMNETIQRTKGDIALHVEADNPAKFLYEKVGFTNPYLEMRLKKNQ